MNLLIFSIFSFTSFFPFTMGNSKVQVTVYFESMCPGCHDFITKILNPALDDLNEIVDITLLPYGNAISENAVSALSGEHDDKKITCQHGSIECKGNTWDACAIRHYPAFVDHWPFILCMEEHFATQLMKVESCAGKAKLDYDLLKSCADGQEGVDALYDMGTATGEHTYVPWVIVNGKVLENQDQFLRVVCDQYDDATSTAAEVVLPEGCRDHNISGDKSRMEFDRKRDDNDDVYSQKFGHFCYDFTSLSLISEPVEEDEHILQHFNSFKTIFQKTYADESSELQALNNFHASMLRLAKHSNPAHGITKFSDLSTDEFKSKYLNFRATVGKSSSSAREKGPAAVVNVADLPCLSCNRYPELSLLKLSSSSSDHDHPALDWTTKGAVTPVKDQGDCGSCWSFGTVGTIEGSYFLTGNPLTSLSAQQLVSCDDEIDMGCGGGLPDYAFDYIAYTANGLVSDEQYPYTSGDGYSGTCLTDRLEPKVTTLKNYYQISNDRYDEPKIQDGLTRLGPLVMGINASPMQDYHHGVDDPSSDCLDDREDLNHSVLVVGYGWDDVSQLEFWKIKNSWNTDWGEDGYYRIRKGVNACGLAYDTMHATADPVHKQGTTTTIRGGSNSVEE